MTPTNIEQRVEGLEETTAQSMLINGCINCIEQCNQILNTVSHENYIDASMGGASIGAHIRHILDKFHCFFVGLPEACIDYDTRKRDREIESNIGAAAFALATVGRRIEQLRQAPARDGFIEVREAVLAPSPAVGVSSTLERELMSLITHSIHHLAIIALIAKSFGYPIDDDFGKAPSTLVYERNQAS
ncbi:MAG: hypothetical protein WDZ52_12290 [Pseudohongiellaceae bacterium]